MATSTATTPNNNYTGHDGEQIVMMPVKKTSHSTIIRMERVRQDDLHGATVIHTAGGDHQGLVIAKELPKRSAQEGPPHLQLEFKVFLVNSQNNSHTQESRHMKFWFKPMVSEVEQTRTAQDFFKELVSPMEFPRDYVGFLKKIMKLLQTRYPGMKRIDVELTQLNDLSEPPSRPTTPGGLLYSVGRPWTPDSICEMILNGVISGSGPHYNVSPRDNKPSRSPSNGSSGVRHKVNTMYNSSSPTPTNTPTPSVTPTPGSRGTTPSPHPLPRSPQPPVVQQRQSPQQQVLIDNNRQMLNNNVVFTEQVTNFSADYLDTVSLDDSVIGKVEVNEDKVLEMIESAYPNPLSVTEIAKQCSCGEDDVGQFIGHLESRGLVRAMESHHGRNYVRVTSHEQEIKVVRQMPTVHKSQQPTIAIITAQFCEKLAVDAMIENKDIYVRYTTVGESNVYTLGNIGAHRVVATKLPSVGHTRAAMIAAGNTTTRLLGSFQKVEYVFLVGCGGGVPHYTDHTKHVRLGDVVISTPPQGRSYIYAYCDQVKRLDNGGFMFEAKTWTPPNLNLQHISQQLCAIAENNPEQCPWVEYMEQGLGELQTEIGGRGKGAMDFRRPPPETDRLYMSLGGKDIIEVSHPLPPQFNGQSSRTSDMYSLPRIHFGAIGSGRHVVRDDAIRQEFANLYGVLAFDTEFDAVVESIFGNRKDSYIFIRGISDYRDGMRKKDWQAYAALAAASFMKAVICALEPLGDD